MQISGGRQPFFKPKKGDNGLVYQKPMIEGPKLLLPHDYEQQCDYFVGELEPCLTNPTSGFQKLNEETRIFIKERFEFDKIMMQCESKDKYTVHAPDQDGHKIGSEIFICTENANFRNFLSLSCQPFQMVISILQRGEAEGDKSAPFLLLERPWQWTFLCFNRPYMTVTLVEDGKSEYLGKIKEPCSWPRMKLKVYDKDDNHKYTIVENTFLLGALSGCPSELFSTAVFDIKKPTGGEILSSLKKRSSGCLKAGFDRKNSYMLSFPDNSPPNDKALLMSAALFLNYQHFDAD